MSWLTAFPVLLTTAGLVFIPGFLVAVGLRFRGFSSIALAPVFSTAVSGVFAAVAGLAGIPWNPLVFLIGAVLTAAAGYLLTGLRRSSAGGAPAVDSRTGGRRTGDSRHVSGPAVPMDRPWRSMWLPLVAAGIGAAMLFRRLTQLIGVPEQFAQGFDNVFHLNAIQYIVNTGNASSLTLGHFQDASGIEAVYPAAWHTYASMTMQLTGSSVPVAENAINLVLSALIWPLACVFLARTIFGSNPVIILAAGVLSAVQVAFPYLLLVWGPLFPNALSLSMLPAVIAVVVILTGNQQNGAAHPASLRWWLALLLGLAGLVTAHMSAINALLVFVLPLLITAFVRRVGALRGASTGAKLRYLIPSVLFAAVLFLVWLKLRPGFYDFWGPSQTTGGAIGEALTNGPLGNEVNWTVTILAVSGAIFLFHIRRHRWLVFSYATSVALYVVDASMDRGFARNFWTGTWYQDTNRLAAFLPLFVTPLAAVGLWALLLGARNALRLLKPSVRLSAARARILASVGVVVLTAGLATLTYFGPTQEYVARSLPVYILDENSAVLTPDELELLDRVDEYVPETAVIADNPWNGSSLAYVFSGRDVLTPHLFASPDPERRLLSEQLAAGSLNPDICSAVEAEGVEYILDFGDRYLVDNPSATEYPGVTNVVPSPGIELVTEVGEAKLYSVTGCR